MKLTVRVKPGASKEKLEVMPDGGVTLWVRAKPVDGQANEAVVRALADHYEVAKSRVRIRSGALSKTKIVEILEP